MPDKKALPIPKFQVTQWVKWIGVNFKGISQYGQITMLPDEHFHGYVANFYSRDCGPIAFSMRENALIPATETDAMLSVLELSNA